jgi:Zn-dependent protease with chaperone function
VALWGGLQVVWLYERVRGRVLSADDQDMVASIAQLVFIGGFVAVIFSRLSKRFEHQADWFAARHMAESLAREPEVQVDAAALAAYVGGAEVGLTAPLDQTGAGPAAQGGPETHPPLPSDPAALRLGAGMFINALSTIVELSHRSPDRGGWLHPSVRQRAALLEDLACYPLARARFERKMRCTRVFMALLLVLGVVLTSLHWKDIFTSTDTSTPAPPSSSPSTEATQVL